MSEQRVTITTSDGVDLDALQGATPGARAHVVLSHPHPDYGGSMLVPIFDLLAAMLPDKAIATTRFDFRRPGSAQERLEDLQAALQHARAATPDVPVALVGWSYGADLALATAIADETIATTVAIAPPLRTVEIGALPASHLLLVPERDQFTPPDAVRTQRPDANMEAVDGCDHFLGGFEDQIARRVADHLSSAL